MKKILISLVAAVMLAAFGYMIHSVNAAGSKGWNNATDKDRTAANAPRTDSSDNLNNRTPADNRTANPYGPDRPLTSTSMDQGWASQHEVEKIVGKSVVNAKGDTLGTVKDLVLDDQGRVNFAVVSYGGFLGIGATRVLVPYEALSFDGKGHFALNLSKDQLAAAPRFDEHNFSYFSDRSWTDQVYRYYGVQPRWSEPALNQGSLTPDHSTAPADSSMGTSGSGTTGATDSGSTY